MRAEKDQLNGLTAGLTGSSVPNPVAGMIDFNISNFEKIGCEQNGKNAYLCNVRFDVSGGLFGTRGQPRAGPVHVVRASDGWTIATR